MQPGAQPPSRPSGSPFTAALTAPAELGWAGPALPVVETFHSLQGEGLHAGRSAFFIRLAGCAVGCPWCDTKPSWPEASHPQRSLSDLAREAAAAAAAGAAFVVITGGEPLQHDLGPLCAAIDAACGGLLPLHLETSGAEPLALSGRFDWITLSPKRHRPPGQAALGACHELKVVVHEAADLAFAETMARQASQARQAMALLARAGGSNAGRPIAAEQPHGAVDPAGPDPATAGDAASPTAAVTSTSASTVASTAGSAAGSRQAAEPLLLLQPGWDSRQGQELAVTYVRHHPQWRLSLQSHKWLGVR